MRLPKKLSQGSERSDMEGTTLCYIEKDGKYLMLYRNKKENDINSGKYLGVGGHMEKSESPGECLLREVKEETGLSLTSYKMRGVITFVYGEDLVEHMFLYTADAFTGELTQCSEGELSWVDKDKILDLNLWEGDRLFIPKIINNEEFFTLKLVYGKLENGGEGLISYDWR